MILTFGIMVMGLILFMIQVTMIQLCLGKGYLSEIWFLEVLGRLC